MLVVSPLKRQVNIAIINQGVLSGVILVLFLYCFDYIIASFTFLVKIFMLCILFYIWNIKSGLRAPSSTKNYRLIYFRVETYSDILKLQRFVVTHINSRSGRVCGYAHKLAVRESYTQEIQVVLNFTFVGHPCNSCSYPFKWQCIRKHLYTE